MTKTDIIKALRKLGLSEGMHVILHSSLSSIGHVEGGADAVVDAFLELLGRSGTLVVPTFEDLGIIPKTVEKRREAVQSIHPMASVAAIGEKAEEICHDHWKAPIAHGERTPYTRLRDLGGYVCLLGVDHDRNTVLHTVEALLKLPYLKSTAPSTFMTPEGEQTKSWKFFPGPHRNFIGLDRMLTESGKQRIGKVGRAMTRLIAIRDLLELCLEAGREDPAFVLCDNPNCADCVEQHAAIRCHLFGQQPFTLAAASSLAGRYVPEIIENLSAAGIGAVEIDYIQGEPPERMDTDGLKRVVKEFRAAGVKVPSLRMNVISDRTEAVMTMAGKAGIRRIVMPLSHDAETHARMASDRKLMVSFFNTLLDSKKTSELLLQLKQKNIAAGFTFNPAHFARAGEKPFLESFKTKSKRFMDGLDVEDATFDGLYTTLGGGNGEIREMVSILRAEGFDGIITLGGGNRGATNLVDAARRLYEWMR